MSKETQNLIVSLQQKKIIDRLKKSGVVQYI